MHRKQYHNDKVVESRILKMHSKIIQMSFSTVILLKDQLFKKKQRPRDLRILKESHNYLKL